MMTFSDQVADYVRAGFGGLYVVSPEESRVLREIERVAPAVKRDVWTWTVTRGWRGPEGRRVEAGSPVTALRVLQAVPSHIPDSAILILLDFHCYLEHPEVLRLLRDLLPLCKGRGQVLVCLSPVLRLPPGIEQEFTVVEFELPDRHALGVVLDGVIEAVGAERAALTADRTALLDAASALTANEAENAFALALVRHKGLPPAAVQTVQAEKAAAVKRSGFLEYVEAPAEGLARVGGLGNLVEWLRKRGKAFSDDARAFGLRAPRGILVAGVPGCGKSLTAKCVAASWGLPLYRLDPGRLFGGIVGQSEQNVRTVIRSIEAGAPCVLWIDEIEKGFAGLGGSGSLDSGVTARVIGTLLTWMAEKSAPAFIFATANDVRALPAEMTRKGRFDEIFAVDLPSAAERREIFRIHLQARGRDPDGFDVKLLAAETDLYSGAEIEAAIEAALFDAYDQAGSSAVLTTEHVRQALRTTLPLARTAPDRIEAIRQWAAMHARPASGDPVVSVPATLGRARQSVRRIEAGDNE